MQLESFGKRRIFMTYDVVIIGAGTAGVYAGYELLKLKPH